jgi:hypothetical protein
LFKRDAKRRSQDRQPFNGQHIVAGISPLNAQTSTLHLTAQTKAKLGEHKCLILPMYKPRLKPRTACKTNAKLMLPYINMNKIHYFVTAGRQLDLARMCRRLAA